MKTIHYFLKDFDSSYIVLKSVRRKMLSPESLRIRSNNWAASR